MENNNRRNIQNNNRDRTRLGGYDIAVSTYTQNGQTQIERRIIHGNHIIYESRDQNEFYRVLMANEELASRINSLTQSHIDRVNGQVNGL